MDMMRAICWLAPRDIRVETFADPDSHIAVRRGTVKGTRSTNRTDLGTAGGSLGSRAEMHPDTSHLSLSPVRPVQSSALLRSAWRSRYPCACRSVQPPRTLPQRPQGCAPLQVSRFGRTSVARAVGGRRHAGDSANTARTGREASLVPHSQTAGGIPWLSILLSGETVLGPVRAARGRLPPVPAAEQSQGRVREVSHVLSDHRPPRPDCRL
jgi:hypothetical protein